MEVPRTPTPVTDLALAPVLSSGLLTRIGAIPAQELALLLLALIWEENRRGAAVMNGNIGNIAAGGYVNGVERLTYPDYWRPEWYSQTSIDQTTDPVKKKLYQELHADMLAGTHGVPSAFRAYAGGWQEGIQHFLDLMFQPIYHPLLVAAASGDSLAFAAEIKKHYNPDGAPPGPLANTFAGLVREFQGKGIFAELPKGGGFPVGPSPSPPSPGLVSPSDVIHGRSTVLFLLELGSTGPLVWIVQRLLGEPIGGEFTPALAEAVKRFQLTHHLLDDGVVGHETWSVLINPPVQEAKPTP